MVQWRVIVNTIIDLHFHTWRGISWPTQRLSASQKGFCSITRMLTLKIHAESQRGWFVGLFNGAVSINYIIKGWMTKEWFRMSISRRCGGEGTVASFKVLSQQVVVRVEENPDRDTDFRSSGTQSNVTSGIRNSTKRRFCGCFCRWQNVYHGV
jgi:hypothetical protein